VVKSGRLFHTKCALFNQAGSRVLALKTLLVCIGCFDENCFLPIAISLQTLVRRRVECTFLNVSAEDMYSIFKSCKQ
jgi:hypothetical protein